MVVAFLVAVPAVLWVAQTPTTDPSTSGGGLAGPSGLQPARLCAGCLTTHPSGNFSIPLAGPRDAGKNLFVENGTVLTAEARVEVANFSALGVQVVNVYFPTTEAEFDLASGQLDFSWSNPVVNVSAPGWNGSSILQTSIILPNTTFDGSGTAILTSSMVAVMTQLPWGALSLNVSWRWELSAPGTAASWSGWSGDQGVVPDQYLAVSRTSPLNMLPGTPFTVCVSGAIGGRTLSLHAETPNPYYDFDQVNATIPQNATGPYCWSVPIPATNPNNNRPWNTPVSLIVHVWDYQNFPGPPLTTLLLYVIQVTLVHAYGVTFKEGGLPIGTNWSVTVGTTTLWSKLTYINFHLANGSYSYSVANVANYSRSLTSGTFLIAGTGPTISERFSLVKYVVTFKEGGLPIGTNWSVTVGTTTLWSKLTYINFHLANGSYSYSLGNVTNYSGSPTSGAFLVVGAGLTISDKFSIVKDVMAVKEAGPPLETNWSLTNGPTTQSAKGTPLSFVLANGPCSHSVSAPGSRFVAGGGTVPVRSATIRATGTIMSYSPL